jgi:hypothetical protein
MLPEATQLQDTLQRAAHPQDILHQVILPELTQLKEKPNASKSKRTFRGFHPSHIFMVTRPSLETCGCNVV